MASSQDSTGLSYFICREDRRVLDRLDTRHAVPNRSDGDAAPNSRIAYESIIAGVHHCITRSRPIDLSIHSRAHLHLHFFCSSFFFAACAFSPAFAWVVDTSGDGREARGTSAMWMLPLASCPPGTPSMRAVQCNACALSRCLPAAIAGDLIDLPDYLPLLYFSPNYYLIS